MLAVTGRAFALTCGLAPLAACSSDRKPNLPEAEPNDFGALVMAERWELVPKRQDPFRADPDDAPNCDPLGVFFENQRLEIDTGRCQFATVSQPALLDVNEGDRIALTLSHFDLTAPELAVGYAALRLGDCELWSKTVPIPGDAFVYEETLSSLCKIEAGAPIWFHLNNHGQNNWQFGPLEVAQR